MKKYLCKLFIKAKRGTYYPQIILGLMEPLAKWWKILGGGCSTPSKACDKHH